jgi:hypothetical protein
MNLFRFAFFTSTGMMSSVNGGVAKSVSDGSEFAPGGA